VNYLKTFTCDTHIANLVNVD